LGVSDRHYFAWLAEVLDRFETLTGDLGQIGARAERPELWVLAGPRLDPPIERVRDALGRDRTTVRLFDRFARGPGVEPLDFNALAAVPGDACDVLMMSRASYMIEDPPAFLHHARRMLRPGGLLVVDWLHGSSEAPVLDLPGHHEYEGRARAFHTTYCDREALDEFPEEFGAFIRHVARPPRWVGLAEPGRPLPLRERARRLLAGSPRRDVTLATYLDALRGDLGRAGKRLVEPETLGAHFKVLFRAARYFYPLVGKFHLYLLTVLAPVGK
jgi:SAM-dependent methyltransferase